MSSSKSKLALFPVLLLAACLIAGLYGALHNQISYTVSPDYFHAFKFRQFAIPEHLQGRLGASIVGWYASWWMGLIVGTPILLMGLILPGAKAYARGTMSAMLVAAATALFVGLAALANVVIVTRGAPTPPAGLVDKVAFGRAGTMHNFSYVGGLIGILSGCFYIIQARTRAERWNLVSISVNPTDKSVDWKPPYKILRTINDSEGKRRVYIVRRDNGTFGYEEEYWSDDPYEKCWIPLGDYPLCICDSEETALREAMGNVDWLAGRCAE